MKKQVTGVVLASALGVTALAAAPSSARPGQTTSVNSTAAQVSKAKVRTKAVSTRPTGSIKRSKGRKALSKSVGDIARSRNGMRYVAGATGPRAFDCSGLVVWSYKKATGRTLVRTSYQQAAATKHVKRSKLRRGDLIFFLNNGHVGIVLNKKKFVHAANSRSGVRIDSYKSGYWSNHISDTGRVIINGKGKRKK